jgi:CDP-diacylglycerol--serine O-phosphatidyltransferase
MNETVSWIRLVENKISDSIPLHPNIISTLKLIVTLILLSFALKLPGVLSGHLAIISALFIAFGVLDYLDGLLARRKQLETPFGRVFDKLTDFPIVLVVSALCFDILPTWLLIVKLILDLTLIVLYITGKEFTDNRIWNAINYTVLFTLLIISLKLPQQFFTPQLAIYLLWLNIVLSSVIILYNLGILKKRYIADALSGANLLCGIFSMIFASQGRVEISLLFLMLGAAFDGFDGAAARKYGGTRFGVYSDDIADGVNYAIAPGAALYFAIGGIEGAVVGGLYSLFTISRLVFFTLNKAYSDPNFFCGVPSTVGAIATLCSLILFENYPVFTGMMVGVACILMISFDTHYRHLGRALASNRRIIYGMPVLIITLIAGNLFINQEAPVALILILSMIYGFLPTFKRFAQVIQMKKIET